MCWGCWASTRPPGALVSTSKPPSWNALQKKVSLKFLKKRETQLKKENDAHAYIIGSEKHNTQDSAFCFEDRLVVDEFAALRKKERGP